MPCACAGRQQRVPVNYVLTSLKDKKKAKKKDKKAKEHKKDKKTKEHKKDKKHTSHKHKSHKH